MLTAEYPYVSSNLKSGLGIWGTADPFDATKPNNGAKNPVGALAYFPAASTNGGYYPGMTNVALASTAAGFASGLVCRYVLYKSTANPAMNAAPSVVAYTDETLGIVSGQFSEGVIASNATSGAGWLLPNTGTGSLGCGTAISATILNNGGLGSYVWLAVDGFIPQAQVGATTAGAFVYMSGNFAISAVNDGSSATHKPLGYIISTPASNLGDVMASTPGFYF